VEVEGRLLRTVLNYPPKKLMPQLIYSVCKQLNDVEIMFDAGKFFCANKTSMQYKDYL